MSVRDEGLGVDLITIGDLLGREPSNVELDGLTVKPVSVRVRAKFYNDGKPNRFPIAEITAIKFWIILDCGEKESRAMPHNPWVPGYESRALRRDRYVPMGVSVDQDISDVEREECGTALPGIYFSWDEACDASSDLVVMARIHET